jgi:hypothetical protein
MTTELPRNDSLTVFKLVPNEIEAALIVNTLEAQGISATATGGYVSGFKAEAPGDIRVLVMRSDLQAAREAMDVASASSDPNEGTTADTPAAAKTVPPELINAWRSAIIGLVVLPFVATVYSLYVLKKHRLLSQHDGPVNWRAPAALGVNIFALLFDTLLLLNFFH